MILFIHLNNMRWIIHVDLDSFFASVEELYNPELKGKAFVVGGSSNRGVVATASYEARKFGVGSAMSSIKAKELCPHLVFVKANFERYREYSKQVFELFYELTPYVQGLSLDEAYLDISHLEGDPEEICKKLRDKIYNKTKLTASAGIANNKLLAKIASEENKPNGQFLLSEDKRVDFMKRLPLKSLPGVGKKTYGLFEKAGIKKCGDLWEYSKEEMKDALGNNRGHSLFYKIRGWSYTSVFGKEKRKRASREITFKEDIIDTKEIRQRVENLIKRQKKINETEGIFVKVKFSDFKQTTVDKKGQVPGIDNYMELIEEGMSRHNKPVRLLGLGVMIKNEEEELLFEHREEKEFVSIEELLKEEPWLNFNNSFKGTTKDLSYLSLLSWVNKSKSILGRNDVHPKIEVKYLGKNQTVPLMVFYSKDLHELLGKPYFRIKRLIKDIGGPIVILDNGNLSKLLIKLDILDIKDIILDTPQEQYPYLMEFPLNIVIGDKIEYISVT